MLAHEVSDGILLPTEPKRDKWLASSQGDCKPCHCCEDWKSNGVWKFGCATNTHQPWTTELWGRGRSNNDGTAEPRQLQLVITNEGSIGLHKTHLFQTNLLYPLWASRLCSQRSRANKQGECANARLNSCMMMLSEDLRIRGRWAPRSIPHLIHDHPHKPIILSLHICGGRLSWHEQQFFCSWCRNKSEMGCVGANIATQPIMNCRKSFPTALFHRSLSFLQKHRMWTRSAQWRKHYLDGPW